MEIKWEILSKKKIKTADSLEKLQSILLENRNIAKSDEDLFFNPTNPYDISLSQTGIEKSQVKKFLERIKIAKEKKERTIIFGDYDVDGVSATSIMWMALHKFGLNVIPFIPDRFADGYGIKRETLEKIIVDEPNTTLIVTVDNGIVAHEALHFAKSKSIDVIVTDHHVADKKEIEAHTTIHTTKLCGSGIAWFLSREINPSSESLRKYLALAGVATIADQMSLTGENRSFVYWGLKEINEDPPLGLKALAKASNLMQGKIGVYEIGFILAPRLNAAGRIAHGLDAVRLLCTNNQEKAKQLAEKLTALNLERQQIVESVMNSVTVSLTNEKIIVISDQQYHEGVIGLAAAKLVEKYYRPAIVISKGEKVSKGSARSISGINITNIIRDAKEYLIDGGGHEMAAGFSINTIDISSFIEKLRQVCKEKLTDDLFGRTIKIDCEIPTSFVSLDLVKFLSKFEPFGLGNPAPVFVSRGVNVSKISVMGQTKNHLKLTLEGKLDAVFFNKGDLFDKIEHSDSIDIVYRVDKNEWNGRSSAQIILKDIKLNDKTVSQI